MYKPITITDVRVLESYLKNGGATLPAPITDEIDRLAALRRNAGPERNERALIAAVANAYIAGRDPATDKDVAAIVARQTLATAVPNWPSVLQDWSDRQLATVLVEHADDIMDTCAATVTTAGQALAGARPQLDPRLTLSEQAESALRGGRAQADAWRAATEAVQAIDSLTKAQSLLLFQTTARTYEPVALLLRSHTVPAPVVDTIRAQRAFAQTWRLVTEHGLTITGATTPDLDAAMKRLANERAAEAAAQAEARLNPGQALKLARTH